MSINVLNLIEQRFIKPSKDDDPFYDLKIIGYYSGLTFLNIIGVSIIFVVKI